MGIRFYCPNGHKLNVKGFLAGLRGVCPICGVATEIPLRSTRRSSRKRNSRSAREMPEASESFSQATAAADMDDADSYPATLSTFAATPPAARALADADNVMWYVRPPSGGQFGPAAADVMQTWLAQGRVSADTLVWREGWRDWRRADSVFSELSAGPAFTPLEDVIPRQVTAPVHGRLRKRPDWMRNLPSIVISVLVITAIVLSFVFFVVYFGQ